MIAVGVRVAQYGGSWEHLRDGALRAERLGFESLWVNDHLRSPGRLGDEPTFDALTTLAALAPMTSRARLGTVVLSASYRPPALAAKMATVLDVISGGRLELGLGTGSHEEEHAEYGYPFPPRGERTAGLRRALAVIEAMLDSPEGASLEGELTQAPNMPAPVQRPRPPLHLAAHGPVLLRLAGRRADGVIAAFCPPQELAARLAIAEEARLAAGRPPLRAAIYTFALPVPSRAEAEAWVAADARALGSSPRAYLRWLATTGVVAPPDELRARLDEFAEAGADRAIISLPHHMPLEGIDALAEAVLPTEAPEGTGAPVAVRGRVADNLVELLVERHRRDGRGEDPAVADDRGELTYDGLADLASRAAGALAARGVRRGDRVGIVLPDGRDWCAAFLGTAALGAVAVPLDADGDPAVLADALADCAAALVVTAGDPPPGVPSVGPEDLAAGPPRPTAPVEPGDLAYLVYSSGSTGRPKAAMHAHADLRTGIETYAAGVLGLGPGDRCHSAARLHTSLGFGNGFFRVLGTGATAVMRPARPRPASLLALAAEERVTVLTAVPTTWAQLARYAARRPEEARGLATLRAAVSSGDGLSPTVAAQVRETLGIDVTQGLGCSECSNIVISARLGEPADGSLGVPVPGVEISLRDEEGVPVAPGTPGRLWIRSPSNTTGYWARPELTRDLVHGEWIRMGDMLVEREGRIVHMGRADSLFKVDGKWVSPAEVEDALLGHPAVAEAAVVGWDDGSGLLRAAAAVALTEGAPPEGLEEDLRHRVSERAGAHAVPRLIAVRDELPRLSSGKLDRRRLGAELEELRASGPGPLSEPARPQ